MALNFGADFNNAGEHTLAKGSYLQGDKIHIVKLKEAKADRQKLKDGREVDTINVVFEDENGATFEDRTFELTQDSIERKTFGWGTSASMYDSAVLKFRCYIEHFAPKYNEKLIKGEVKLEMKSWKQFRDSMVAILQAVIKQKTPVWCKLKLIKNNSGFVSLPFFAAVDKEGNAYVNNNFIGNVEILKQQDRDIAFTASEIKKIKAREEAASGTATSTEELISSNPEEISDINMEDFENMTL